MSDADDDQLMELVAAAIDENDPAPEWLESRAKEMHRLVLLETELADITLDSLTSSGAVRSVDTSSRQVRFDGGGIVIDLEVTGAVVLGRVSPPPGSGQVLLDGTSSTSELVIDAEGVFRVVDLPAGPVRFRLTDPAVATAWLVLRSAG